MSGAPRKQEKDYTEEVKSLQPQAEELAKVSWFPQAVWSLEQADDQNGNLQGAIDKITAMEKQTRNVSSMWTLGLTLNQDWQSGGRYDLNFESPNSPRSIMLPSKRPRPTPYSTHTHVEETWSIERSSRKDGWWEYDLVTRTQGEEG